MKILALDLSGPEGSIAWSEPARESHSTSFANDRKHSGLFFENLKACLDRFGKPDRIAIGLGPGSYAGTRIAIATATGLGAASGASLLGVPSVCAMNTDAPEYCVIGDARRQSFYFAQVQDRRCVVGPMLCTEQELTGRLRDLRFPILATEPLALFPTAEVKHPSALVLAQIAAEMQMGVAAQPLEPIYLRAPHITYPKISR